ncbi:hypothetical protein [Xanthomonas vesicatoria]|uniref:hypothetical protein n=1 Tax=Xanthomonas vesicatoria TaxID=56460 RepID=UPI001E58FD3C|nr:hypothetical protein [Xanthomonas vesicatoria]MCC8627485.1 hypothetical protein [Xanthomonas vesicatoria]MDG4484901.1 hypothetical protein [Xanthomonas vesicatoria]
MAIGRLAQKPLAWRICAPHIQPMAVAAASTATLALTNCRTTVAEAWPGFGAACGIDFDPVITAHLTTGCSGALAAVDMTKRRRFNP